VLKPDALRARVGVFTRTTRKGDQIESTDVNFQVLRRTSSARRLRIRETRRLNCGFRPDRDSASLPKIYSCQRSDCCRGARGRADWTQTAEKF
jgi:hypothetical protein